MLQDSSLALGRQTHTKNPPYDGFLVRKSLYSSTAQLGGIEPLKF